jgi:hypothetical protein
MFLTLTQLSDLTGYQRHADQRKWLKARGWVFEVAATGRPIVSTAYAEQRLGGAVSPAPTLAAWSPNLAAIRKAA